MASWWSKKVGQNPPPPPPQPGYAPGMLPPGIGGQQQALNHYLERRGIPQTAAPPPQVAQVGPNEVDVPQYVPPAEGDPYDYHRRLWGWTGNPRGGAGETQTTGNCPNCGSPRYFSRASGAVVNTNTGTRAEPKPECFDCGYPNDQGVLAVSAGKTLPGVAPARSAPGLAPDGSIATLVRQ